METLTRTLMSEQMLGTTERALAIGATDWAPLGGCGFHGSRHLGRPSSLLVRHAVGHALSLILTSNL